MSFELDERAETLEGEFPSMMPGLWESDVNLNFNFIEENLDSALKRAVDNYYINKKLGDISVEYAQWVYDEKIDDEKVICFKKKLSDFDIRAFHVVDVCNPMNYCGGTKILFSTNGDWEEEMGYVDSDDAKSDYHWDYVQSLSSIALSTLETELNNDEEFYNTIINDAFEELM